MGRRTRRRYLIGGVTASLLALGVAALLTAASASSGKNFEALISVGGAPAAPTAAVPAGASSRVSITITNLSNPQKLGSANVTIPASIADPAAAPAALDPARTGWSVKEVKPVDPESGEPIPGDILLELRSGPGTTKGLAKNQSVTVTFGVRTACTTSGTFPFEVIAKQANNFQGDGNEFGSPERPELAISGTSCALEFAAQPADARVDEDITTADLDPAGDPVAVRVVDGSGSPALDWSAPIVLGLGQKRGTAVLSGSTEATPVMAVAAFRDPVTGDGPRLDVAAVGYTLLATSAGLSETESDPFDIVGPTGPPDPEFTQTECEAGELCEVTVTETVSAANISALAGEGEILKAFLYPRGTGPSFICEDYRYKFSTDTLEFDLVTASGGPTSAPKTVVFTLFAPYVTRPASKYEVCWQAPDPFETIRTRGKKGVSTIPDDDPDGWYVGLLPSCNAVPRTDPPCVARKQTNASGDVVITINAPGGDPRARF